MKMSFWLISQFDGKNSMHMLFISQVLDGHIEMMKWLMIFFYFAKIVDATKILVIFCYLRFFDYLKIKPLNFC